jgi:hypothetical protein
MMTWKMSRRTSFSLEMATLSRKVTYPFSFGSNLNIWGLGTHLQKRLFLSLLHIRPQSTQADITLSSFGAVTISYFMC